MRPCKENRICGTIMVIKRRLVVSSRLQIFDALIAPDFLHLNGLIVNAFPNSTMDNVLAMLIQELELA